MLRSQKQLTLTVGKMMDLSLESFTSVRIMYTSFILKVYTFIIITIIDALISNTKDKIVSDHECLRIILIGSVDDAIIIRLFVVDF